MIAHCEWRGRTFVLRLPPKERLAFVVVGRGKTYVVNPLPRIDVITQYDRKRAIRNWTTCKRPVKDRPRQRRPSG